jgi:hypothetical protein
VLNPYTIAGTMLVIVALAGAWRAWLLQARETGFMDRLLRQAGHVPPETDAERTAWVPVVVAHDIAYGEHSRRQVSLRLVPYRGKHHERIGCVLASALLAREGVAV